MVTFPLSPGAELTDEAGQSAGSQSWVGLSKLRYGMLVVCLLTQAITIFFTWPLWQVRETPVHLPLVDLPQIPFGWWLLATLVLLLIRPRLGFSIHAASLLLSFVFDQFRTQPQFIATAVLMAATVDPRGMRLVRWFLASLWTWAGLHKLLSPDWLGVNAWEMTSSLGLDPAAYGEMFGWGVGLGELSVGLLAIFQPRWAAIPCALMHVGIILFLSPLAYNWNYSVMPWNLCTAIVGCWLMASIANRLPQTRWEWLAAALLLIYPAGFYVGWIDHGIASVLYSGNLPDGLITTESGIEQVEGWGELNVPFPNERRLLRQYFCRSAPPGAKLHIADPRQTLDDLYYVKKPDGRIELIELDEFHASAPGIVAGVGLDDRHSIFLLGNRGVVMLKRTEHSAIYAVRIDPDVYRADLLQLLAGLPNLEQLDLTGCAITDDDLKNLPLMPKLEGIGIDETQVTDNGLLALLRQPRLTYIESEGSRITAAGLEEYQQRRSRK